MFIEFGAIKESPPYQLCVGNDFLLKMKSHRNLSKQGLIKVATSPEVFNSNSADHFKVPNSEIVHV